ncbi:MAG: VWA domain-containing protein [Chloroflexota bacterium]
MARPTLLLLLLLLPLLGWISLRHWRWQRDALARLGNGHWRQTVRPSHTWLNGPTAAWLLAAALALVALAGPQWGQSTQQVETDRLQLMILLDLSRSMLAEDAPGSRLAEAKRVVETAVAFLNESDQIGLIAFAGETRLLLPLTSAKEPMSALLPTLSPDDFAVQGTVLGPALAVAQQAFPMPRAGQPLILLISDGEEHSAGSLQMAQQAAAEEILIITVGVGSEAGAELPILDEAGQPVVSRLNSGLLQELAAVGNGRYLTTPEELPDYLQTIRQTYTGSQLIVTPTERYQLFLLAALLLFCAQWLPLQLPSAAKVKAGLAGLFLLLVALTACQSTNLPETIAEGNAAFSAAAYDEAKQQYTQALAEAPNSAAARFNLANVWYRLGGFETAVTHLQQLPPDTSPAQQAASAFNLGNSYFQLGDLEAAVAAYQTALRLSPHDLDAKHNLELALQMMASEVEETAVPYPAQQKDQSQPEIPTDSSSPPSPPLTPDDPVSTSSPTTPLINETATQTLNGMQLDIQFLPISQNSLPPVDVKQSMQNDW